MITKLFSQKPKENGRDSGNNEVFKKKGKPNLADVISARRGEIISSLLTGFIAGLFVGGIVVAFVLSHKK
jgi:hypothetical protein